MFITSGTDSGIIPKSSPHTSIFVLPTNGVRRLKARAFQNAIRQAKQCVESGVVEDMRAKLGALSEAEEERA